MSLNPGNVVSNFPVLYGKNWNRWCVQLKAILGYQDVMNIVEEGYSPLVVNAIDAQKLTHKENKKKDCKAMVILHQSVDPPHFEKNSRATNSKEAWEILEKCNAGAEQLKKVRLQTMRRQYELMQMDENERVSEFFNRILILTNSMKSCGEVISDLTIVEKILRTPTPRFDHIVVAIEESRKIDTVKIEELQGSLEAHEQRLNERNGGSRGKSGQKYRGRGRNFRGSSERNYSNHENIKARSDQPESSIRRGGFKQFKGKKSVDKRKVKCYSCNNFGHYSSECHASNRSDDHRRNLDANANLVKEETTDDEDPCRLLMMITKNDVTSDEVWYLDSGCSNHMTGHKEWLVNFDESKKTKVRFADNRTVDAKGTGDLLIRREDGKKALITEVLYVPAMKSNLISIGQLLEKGFNMNLQHVILDVYDDTEKKILSAPLTRNRTFQVKFGAFDAKCFNAEKITDETWL
ncbi:uncharacterized protein [Cicer arietinum]|uniref:Uncharacterized protein LOC113787202 n=1 Tax=Cicer arietinum TaxID=3827 RepID=A0A3Q7YCX7_CICAR|nr:uncharacterized protein LOC113787202 [Cicer arietinum]